MANIDRTAEAEARYGTSSHFREMFKSGGVADQLKWSDLHPPGVTVLPKGSPPAGSGEINWEDTLGGKFAFALTQLEGMLYALYGSRPHAHTVPGPTWVRTQWYDRLHPRCLWGAESWEPEATGCFHYIDFAEYVALGDLPPSAGWLAPTVPIQSRSGDPEAQYRRPDKDATYFPAGSISRTQSSFPFDPEGSGWFGATQPGRDARPNGILAGGPWIQEAGESVTFSWVKPDGVTAPTTMKLWWSKKEPGGSWTSFASVTMTETSGTWDGSLPAQKHGTELRWYLEYFYDDTVDVYQYAPGGEAAPASGEEYYLQWFTHYNPYEHGFPEMLEDHDGIDVRHGTDFYHFDGSETIQPELLNLIRFAIAYIVGATCLNDDGGCNDQPFGSVAHHNPRTRGAGDDGHALCCVPLPIKFYWSGSNVYPHYMRGGKGDPSSWDPLDTRPMTNHPDEVSFDAAQVNRKSWRGIDNLFRDAPLDNPDYGGGYSWGVAPAEFQLWAETAGTAVYATYEKVGLIQNDVIDPIHIQEIIDAVEYLIDYGVWSHASICTTKRTPSTYRGLSCGTVTTACQESCTSLDPCAGGGYGTTIDDCQLCCENVAECNDPGFSCDPFTAPDWATCRSGCPSDKCQMSASRSANVCDCTGGCWQTTSLIVNCDGNSPCDTCGSYSHGPGSCPEGEEYDEPTGGYGACSRCVAGLSYFACAPTKCEFGWDDDHGGSFKKSRFDDACPDNNVVATGPPGNEFSGNCWGDMFACGTTYPLGEDDGLWFGEVAGIYWEGVAGNWWTGCSGFIGCGGGSGGSTKPAPLPGIGLHDPNGDHLCVVEPPDWINCSCTLEDFPVCLGEGVWVAMDLNLDDSGRPYRNFPGRNGELSPYSGDGVPILKDYDLTKDPSTWMHDCPCETWTGAGTC